jgi:hypothetical protein
MTITITWWMLPVVLFFSPFVWLWFYEEEGGDYSFDFTPIILVFGGCWLLALGVLIGHFV